MQSRLKGQLSSHNVAYCISTTDEKRHAQRELFLQISKGDNGITESLCSATNLIGNALFIIRWVFETIVEAVAWHFRYLGIRRASDLRFRYLVQQPKV